MSTYSDWRIAFAKQARADLQARDRLLEHPELPDCQQLHFLQMACEKICKSHLCGQGTDPRQLQSSHAYISNVLPLIVRQQFSRQSRQLQIDRAWVIAAVRKLARKIELLAPSVRDGGSHPANCEYPWIASNQSMAVPAEHNFHFDLLFESAGRHLLKALHRATLDLTSAEHDVK